MKTQEAGEMMDIMKEEVEEEAEEVLASEAEVGGEDPGVGE